MSSHVESVVPPSEEPNQDLRSLLESWKGSITEFARKHGSSPQQIYYLRSKLRKQTRTDSRCQQVSVAKPSEQHGFARVSVKLVPAELRPISQRACEKPRPESKAPARIQLGGSLVIELSHVPSAEFVAELAGRMQCNG